MKTIVCFSNLVIREYAPPMGSDQITQFPTIRKDLSRKNDRMQQQ